MTIIAAYYYNEGKRVREIRLDEHVELNENRSGFCWIALSEPTADELSAIQTTYNLHPLAIDNAMHPLCPPKLEVYNDELYVVAQTAELVGDRISYGKMAIFTGHNHLITVRHGNAGALGKLREQLEASPTQFGKGVDYVLHAVDMVRDVVEIWCHFGADTGKVAANELSHQLGHSPERALEPREFGP